MNITTELVQIIERTWLFQEPLCRSCSGDKFLILLNYALLCARILPTILGILMLTVMMCLSSSSNGEGSEGLFSRIMIFAAIGSPIIFVQYHHLRNLLNTVLFFIIYFYEISSYIQESDFFDHIMSMSWCFLLLCIIETITFLICWLFSNFIVTLNPAIRVILHVTLILCLKYLGDNFFKMFASRKHKSKKHGNNGSRGNIHTKDEY